MIEFISKIFWTSIYLVTWVLLTYLIHKYLQKTRLLQMIFPEFKAPLWDVIFAMLFAGALTLLLPIIGLGVIMTIIVLIAIFALFKLIKYMKFRS